MANLRCWKKTKEGWENKKDDYSLIRINSEGDIISGKLANWRVEKINEFQDNELLKTTKTKIQAEKFAKSYIRKNDKC